VTESASDHDKGGLPVAALRTANLAVKFALEFAAVAAFAYWGATVAGGVVAVVLAIAAPLVAVVLWGRFAAPRAARRLPLRLRAPFELGVFALAALALLAASEAVAIMFTSVVIANALLLTLLSQWEA
jgi:Protein of unknown function (DUF2568)